MSYTVDWKPSAEQELARIWTDAPDRGDVTAAANTIDARLAANPHTEGESRTGASRILFMPPLAVIFEVQEQDRFVDVLKVWRISGPSP